MDMSGALGLEAVVRINFANDFLRTDFGGETRANARRIAFGSAQRDFQPMGLGKMILKNQERAAASLAHHQIFPAIAVEVRRHHRAPVSIAVGSAGEGGDFEELLAARIEENAVAF